MDGRRFGNGFIDKKKWRFHDEKRELQRNEFIAPAPVTSGYDLGYADGKDLSISEPRALTPDYLLGWEDGRGDFWSGVDDVDE